MAAPSAATDEAKLDVFLQWLQANGAQLRGCTIRPCCAGKGLGVFATDPLPDDGVVMVVPLELAITPMRVLQDSLLGPTCRAMLEEEDVDDRFLVMLFLAFERLRHASPWKPYFDMLPSSFGSPLWFTEDELSELKGTTLYQATLLQKKTLEALYNDKVKDLLGDLLHKYAESSVDVVQFEDFLWANSIFWTRALNIPLPRSYVFPESLEGQENLQGQNFHHEALDNGSETVKEGRDEQGSKPISSQTVWVEGLIPGIDFCNHDVRAAATWEVDHMGSVTGIPNSMYLILADRTTTEVGQEILISYGNKGNEELLYLYGFVMENNLDCYLMVHYPIEAFQTIQCADSKAKLLEMQKAELRCLLPKSLLDHGFLSVRDLQDGDSIQNQNTWSCSYSWSGQRNVPSYLCKLVFPQSFLAVLRTIAMKEHEVSQVLTLLQEVVGSNQERQPSEIEVQAAIWEVCGDRGALELLVNLLRVKMMQLEEGSGTEACDSELLKSLDERKRQAQESGSEIKYLVSRNKRSALVYRRGQKLLTSLFLKEAEQALQICVNEQP